MVDQHSVPPQEVVHQGTYITGDRILAEFFFLAVTFVDINLSHLRDFCPALPTSSAMSVPLEAHTRFL